MLKINFTITNKLILIIFTSFLLFSVCFAQSRQVEIVAVYDPTGPVTVNLNSIPPYVGSETTLTWSAASNSTYYTAQVSTNSTFTSIISTSTTSSLTTMFSGLPEGISLYYRIVPY